MAKRSRPYSFRLSFSDDEDVKAMGILDPLNNHEEYNTGQWIRDAILLRIDIESALEGSEHTIDEIREEIKEFLQGQANSQGTEGVPTVNLDHDSIQDNELRVKLEAMSEQERQVWLLNAGQMRYLIEKNAPVFFSNVFQNHNQEDSRVVKTDPEQTVESNISIAEESSELPEQEEHETYEERLIRAIPDLTNLSDPIVLGGN